MNLLVGRFNRTEYGVMDRTHLHFYTFRTAAELVASAGYHVVDAEAAANALGPLVRWLPALRGLFGIHIILTARKP
jgi:hypothetical protein